MEKSKEVNEKIKEVVLRDPETQSCAKTIDEYQDLLNQLKRQFNDVFYFTDNYYGISHEPTPAPKEGVFKFVRPIALSNENLQKIRDFANSSDLFSKATMKRLGDGKISKDRKAKILQAQVDAKEFLKVMEKYPDDLYENYMKSREKLQSIIETAIRKTWQDNEELVNEALFENGLGTGVMSNKFVFTPYNYFNTMASAVAWDNMQGALYSFNASTAKEIASANEIKKEDEVPELE